MRKSGFDAGSIAGQYYSSSENEIINLGVVTKLWHQEDGVFSLTDRLYYKSCGEEYFVDKSPDEITEIFNKLSDDGSFIQIGNNLFNTKSIQSVYYDGKYLHYQIAGDKKKEKVSLVHAEDVLMKLGQQKRFQRIGDHLVNMNKVVNMRFVKGGWISNDRLKINFLGSADYSIDMPKLEVERAQIEALKRPQFKALGGETVNVAVAGNVWVKKDVLHIKYPGTDCKIKMGASDNNAIEHFSARGGYISVEGEKVNPKITSKAWYTEGGFFSRPCFHFNILSQKRRVVMGAGRSQPTISQLEKDRNYIAIGEELININSIGSAYYDGKKLHFTQGHDVNSKKMNGIEAQKILKKISAHEKFLEIDGEVVNVELVSRFGYDQGRLECLLGQDTREFEISALEAKGVLDKIRRLGLDKKQQLDSIRHGFQDGECDESAWDPDLLAEIYEEIDTMHTASGAGMLVSVTVSMTYNSTS